MNQLRKETSKIHGLFFFKQQKQSLHQRLWLRCLCRQNCCLLHPTWFPGSQELGWCLSSVRPVKAPAGWTPWRAVFWWPLLERSSAAPILIIRSVCDLWKYKMFICQHMNSLQQEKHITILTGGKLSLCWLIYYFFNNLIGSCNRHNDDKKIRVAI